MEKLQASRAIETIPSMNTATEVTVRLHEIIKNFDGSGDISVWLNKLKLIADMKGIPDLSVVLPLFLEGQAFAVYEHMPDEEKKSSKKIERTLRTPVQRLTQLTPRYRTTHIILFIHLNYNRLYNRLFIFQYIEVCIKQHPYSSLSWI